MWCKNKLETMKSTEYINAENNLWGFTDVSNKELENRRIKCYKQIL